MQEKSEVNERIDSKIDRTLSAFIGLWDDYADRSIGWGGFFVASMFGMYSMLTVIEPPVPAVFWAFIYLMLWAFGAYSLANLVWYLTLTNRITTQVQELCPDFKQRQESLLRVSKGTVWSLMHSFAMWREGHPKLTLIILIGYYIFMTWVPFIIVTFWLKAIPFL